MSVKRFDKFVSEISKDTKINIHYKNKSFLMKFIGIILFFNPNFMNKYITTIGHTIYYPTRTWIEKYPIDAILVTAHEYVHIKDNEKMGNLKYVCTYFFPQILSLFSLLSLFVFITPYALLFLFFIVFLAPIPAPGRKEIELNGYKMTLFILYLLLKEREFSSTEISTALYDNIDNFININFIGSPYYFMWPFGVKKELKQFVLEILLEMPRDYVYLQVAKAFEESGRK